MRLLAYLAVSILLPTAHAQLPELYRREYNAPSNHSDDGVCLAADSLGSYVAGSAYSAATGGYDAHLLALNPDGTTRWIHQDRVQGETEEPIRLAVDRNRNVFMLSFVRIGNPAAIRLVKFSPDGTRLWKRDLDTGTTKFLFDEGGLGIDALGNAYIGCARNQDFLVAKIASDGTVLWERTVVDPQESEEVTDLVVDPLGGVVATGTAGMLQGGYRTVKYDANGNLVWTNFNAGQIGNTLGPSFIERQASGNFVVVSSPESSFGVTQYRLYQINPAGTTLWHRDYKDSPQLDCEATGIAVDRHDNIIVSGFRLGGGADTVVVKYDSLGNRIWESNYTPSSGVLYDVAVDQGGNVTVCGFLNSGTSTGVLLRYDQNGVQKWVKTRASDHYVHVATDAKGSVYVVGSVFNQATNQDFVFGKYSWLAKAQ